MIKVINKPISIIASNVYIFEKLISLKIECIKKLFLDLKKILFSYIYFKEMQKKNYNNNWLSTN